MFPTKEKKDSDRVEEFNSNVNATFESIEQFSLWLDSELDQLVGQFSEFETDKSVRKYFKRAK